MASQYNRIYVATATIGTGTVTLGTVVSAQFCTFADAGAADADQIRSYIIEEGTDFEIGYGTYNSAGPTLTRATVRLSRIAGVTGTTKMTLAGNATVRCIAAAEDLVTQDTSGNVSITGTLGVAGNFAVATNKLTVAAASGNTAVAGTLAVTGASTLTGTVQIGATASQYAAYLSVRGRAAAFEWGHGNTAGYGSAFGYNAGDGKSWIAFGASQGTTSNTFKTWGLKGFVWQSDLNGGCSWNTVATASADDQTLTSRMSLSTAGVLALSATTASTSTTTGALTVAGGLGVVGAMYVGGTANLLGALAVTGTVGIGQAASTDALTIKSDGNSVNQLRLKDSTGGHVGALLSQNNSGAFLFDNQDNASIGFYSNNGSGEGMVIGAGGAGVTIGLSPSSNSGQNGLWVQGVVNVESTTASTSTTTGALKVGGGIGVAKELFVGLTANVAGVTTLASGTATPAGGSTAARLLFGTTAGFGIYYGSGAPSVSAAQGSIYIRSDGSTTATRLYVNTNGTTGWTNFTSAT